MRRKQYLLTKNIHVMSKNKIHIEHELRSNSQSIIWHLISTAEGLSRWLADDVREDGNSLTLTWGETWSHHEIRKATITGKAKNRYLRFRWDDEDDPEAYIELLMEKSDLTNDFILSITDFAEAGDEDQLEELWADNLERLHTTTGL